jgi:hypothetical protein
MHELDGGDLYRLAYEFGRGTAARWLSSHRVGLGVVPFVDALVVEQDPDALQLICTVLEASGFRATPAAIFPAAGRSSATARSTS